MYILGVLFTADEGMDDISLCHRPRNCNLSNLCGCCKSLAPEIVSWFLGLCYSRKDFCRAPIDLHS